MDDDKDIYFARRSETSMLVDTIAMEYLLALHISATVYWPRLKCGC